MTRERAFWEATATVAIPSLIIWGVLLYVTGANATADEWLIYAILIALPFPLIFPIYKRYLLGPTPKAEKPRTLLIAAAVCGVVGAANVVFTLVRHRDRSDLVVHLFFGVAWLLIGGDKLRRAIRGGDNLTIYRPES